MICHGKRALVVLAASTLFAALAARSPARADDAQSGPSTIGSEPAVPEPSPASAEMLKSMREKGILSEEEYEDLYRRQARYEAKQRAQQALPGWMQDWTFGGDLRLRMDYEKFTGQEVAPLPAPQAGQPTPTPNLTVGKDNVDGTGTTQNPNQFSRAVSQRVLPRIELRIGAEKRLSSDFTVGFRLATSQPTSYGSSFNAVNGKFTGFTTATLGNDRSANVDFGNYFSLKSIFVDRAYLRWNPDFARTLQVNLGKFGNPFISNHFSQDLLVWDKDIQLEGADFTYRFDAVPEVVWLDTAGGLFVLDTINFVTTNPINATTLKTNTAPPQMDDRTPLMWAIQGGVTAQPLEWFQTGIRGSYYDLQNLDQRFSAAVQDLGNGGGAISNNPMFFLLTPGSPFFQNGASTGRMQEVVADIFMTFTPFGENWPVTPWYQWMSILSAMNSSQNIGYGIGIDIGNPDIIRLSFLYAMLQRNATVALFTDSDMFDGFTNARGLMVSAERNLMPGVRARVAYFHSRLAQPNCEATQENLPALFCDTTALDPFVAAFRQTSLDRWRLQMDLRVDF